MAPLKWVFTDDAPIELATRGVAEVSTDWNQSASARGLGGGVWIDED